MPEEKWRDQRRRNRRASLSLLKERLLLVVGFTGALILGAAVLIYSTGGFLRVGGGERSLEERAALLESGECALRNGEPVGRIIGVLTPSRGMPKRRYQIEALDEKKVLQVLAEEVEIVACTTLAGRE